MSFSKPSLPPFRQCPSKQQGNRISLPPEGKTSRQCCAEKWAEKASKTNESTSEHGIFRSVRIGFQFCFPLKSTTDNISSCDQLLKLQIDSFSESFAKSFAIGIYQRCIQILVFWYAYLHKGMVKMRLL